MYRCRGVVWFVLRVNDGTIFLTSLGMTSKVGDSLAEDMPAQAWSCSPYLRFKECN